MMEILNRESVNFIEEHKHRNLAELALLLNKRKELPSEVIINQINGLQKAHKKLPFLSEYPKFRFPSPTSLSQSSSQKAAEYKAKLIGENQKIADLSGGMGIDSYFLSKRSMQLDYVEERKELYELAVQNFKVLNAQNIKAHHQTAEEFLAKSSEQYDLIYLDPDRRKEGKRMIGISDCSPDVSSILDLLFEKSDQIMVKYSPVLDITAAIKDLQFVNEVHILSIDNDCKELLFLIKKEFEGTPKQIAIDLSNDKKVEFSFSPSEEKATKAEYGSASEFLYEPNVAVMKSGAFNLIADRFKLKKLAPNTHLYTSNQFVTQFPGRQLKIIEVLKNPKSIKDPINIISRNSGLSVEQIKKKYKLKEGGTQFLYACRLQDGKRIFLLAEKVILSI